MHEMALAEGVFLAALEAARAHGRAARRVVVRIGELQQIDDEVFASCLEAVRPAAEPLLAGLSLRLERQPARLECRGCGSASGLDEVPSRPGPEALEAIHFVPELAHAWLRCPACGSADFDITAGRGIDIERIELEDPDEKGPAAGPAGGGGAP